jgi:hypothetical protein
MNPTFAYSPEPTDYFITSGCVRWFASDPSLVRLQNICCWLRKIAERWPRVRIDIRPPACGVASGDIR